MANNGQNRSLYVYNKTREPFVAPEAVLADSYLRRLVGLLGKTKRCATLGRGLDCSLAWRSYERNVVPDRCNFPRQEQSSCPRRGICSSLPHLEGVTQSVERA